MHAPAPAFALARRGRFPLVPWATVSAGKLREDLLSNLRFDAGRPLRLGTDCSGAEAPLFALQEIGAALKGLGADFRIDHRFSCDVNHASRHFIFQNCKPEAFFADLLARETIGHCLRKQRPRLVPGGLDIYVAGFPCKDFSSLNKMRHVGLSGPNAPIFHGVVKYIQRHEPTVFVLENVLGLLHRRGGEMAPIKSVMSILRSIPGYACRAWKVNTADFGLPQCRRRVYIVGVHTGKATLRKPLDKWGIALRKLMHEPYCGAGDFVLDEEEPEVEDLADLQRSRKRMFHLNRGRWVALHEAYRRDMQLGEGPGPYVGSRNGFIRHIQRRGRDVLEFCAARVEQLMGQPPEQTACFAEVSQSPSFCVNTIKDDISPCVTPTGRLWCFSRYRWLTGLEKLALQGFPVDELNLSGLSDSEVNSLAGNSMSVPVVGTFLMMALAMVDFREPARL